MKAEHDLMRATALAKAVVAMDAEGAAAAMSKAGVALVKVT